MCGENLSCVRRACGALGSPPRVRGKQKSGNPPHVRRRITPACAGKTKRLACYFWLSWDHPRVCGENLSRIQSKYPFIGSPPRVRGKLEFLLVSGMKERITPACAGKTEYDGKPTLATRDHPRVCGENGSVLCSQRIAQGSPPRVRGKRSPDSGYPHVNGITPACAGKTILIGYSLAIGKDHPRVCGENGAQTEVYHETLGSPPRVRGKRATGAGRNRRSGITPACAGKTPSNCPTKSTSRDHPRVCGENIGTVYIDEGARGSPPRVRGKLSTLGLMSGAMRITPACAGKTLLFS